jgi:oligopeptide/dipeptide ABC transporter ATP-binding protein
VYFRPWHPYSKVLVASNPEPDPRSERQRATIPIAGEIPSAINIGVGCRFASRCQEVMDVCRTATPVLRTLPDGASTRQVACHLFESDG